MNTGASLLEGKTDDWGIVFDINVIGTCTVTREIINLMREAVSNSIYCLNFFLLNLVQITVKAYSQH